jgi:cation transport regulator ChaB
MPYRTTVDLPDSVRDHLPPHAQAIYLAAFNNAWRQHARDPDGEASVASHCMGSGQAMLLQGRQYLGADVVVARRHDRTQQALLRCRTQRGRRRGTGVRRDIQTDHDRSVIRCLPQQGARAQAGNTAYQTPIDPQRHEIAGNMRRFPRPDVPESWQQRRSDQIVITHHGCLVRQHFGDAPELPAVQDLAM